MRELAAVRKLAPLLRQWRATVMALVGLGSIAALSEGLGIGLFIPLLRSVQGLEHAPVVSSRLGAMLAAPFSGLAPSERLPAILACLAGLVVLRSLLVFGHEALLARLTSRLAHRLRSRAFDQLLAVEQRFLDRRDRGALFNLLEGQTWEVSSAVGTVARLLTRLVKVSILGAVLLWISWPLTLAVGGTLGVVALIVWPIAKRVETLSRDEVRDWERMAQRMLETLHGMRTVRVFGQERREQGRLERCSAAESRTFERLQLLQAAMPPAMELLVGAVMLGVLGLALRVPAYLPEVLTFLIVLYRLHPQVQQINAARVALAASRASIDAVHAFLETDDKPYVVSGVWPCEGVRDAIAFRGVTFHYDPARAAALDAVDLTIPAGRTTAIVGPSGAGKSTLLQLLLRLFDPTAGSIEVDGVPLPELELASWRARVAIVPQDVHLFNATIAENIAYGRPGALGTDALEEAARLADAHEFIRALPGGYATRVGDDGIGLSNGQRQRIALARALLCDPDVLILDEATSAVDPISAAVIRRSVAQLACGRTVVIVTHRLAAIEHADRVVLLDHGRVREVGSAAELRARGGAFARMDAAGTMQDTTEMR